MHQYKNLIRTIMREGQHHDDRTGTGTTAIFGHQMRFDLGEGFPLVTLKRTFFKGVAHELLWFLRGETNIRNLQQVGVHIWDEWADEDGDLGPIYGHQWRSWGSDPEIPFGHDQLVSLLVNLKEDPHGRRHIVSAWDPNYLPFSKVPPHEQPIRGRMALAPCHVMFQMHVSADMRLSCQVYQRSADTFLGVPFNIASYALLTHLFAHHLGLQVGDLIWTGGDCHIYDNHRSQVEEMMQREPLPLPQITFHHSQEKLPWQARYEDIELLDYQYHPAISAPVAV